MSSYLLPLLKLQESDINQIEAKHFDKHSLTKFYLKGKQHPIIISTVHEAKYRICGKNDALYDIASELQACLEYHFYDDDKDNINKADTLGYVTTHRVDTINSAQFKVVQTHDATMIFTTASLIHQLTDYKTKRMSNSLEYTGWGSLLSFNLFGYSRTAKIKAVDALIHSLKTGEDLDSMHFGPLNSGDLGMTLNNWQEKTGKTWQIAIEVLSIYQPTSNEVCLRTL